MKNILLYPWDSNYFNDSIFEDKNLYNLLPQESACKQENPFRLLRQGFENAGYHFTTIDKGNIEETEYIIFFDIPEKHNDFYCRCLENKLYEKLIVFLWEPEVVKPNNYSKKLHKNYKFIFTWNDDLVDGKRYYKFNYPEPYYVQNIYEKSFNEKKFCTLISGNKTSKIKGELYSEREKFIRFFEDKHPKEFEFFGRGWNKPKSRLERYFPFLVRHYKTYIGQTDNKMRTLSDYKYCVCYENQCNVNGYITEKIFDCFLSGCVPIYWGANNILEYVPEQCFIDRRKFNSNEELYQYIQNISEIEYNAYIEAIKEFLQSERYYPFTDKCFVENIVLKLTK